MYHWFGLAILTVGVVTQAATNAMVANPFLCKSCHLEQYRFWESTKHASAYLPLFAKNEHFDPACIGCHSLGFGKKGGFSSITRPVVSKIKPDKSQPWIEKIMKEVFDKDKGGKLDSRTDPGRYAKLKEKYHERLMKAHLDQEFSKIYIGVQCEHCHGSRVEHLRNPAKGEKASVSLNRCKQCHKPPNAPNFDPKIAPLASCPRIKKG